VNASEDVEKQIKYMVEVIQELLEEDLDFRTEILAHRLKRAADKLKED